MKSFLVHFLGLKQQDCQENDGINIANVGARTTVICQTEEDDGNKENDNKNPDKSITDTDADIANNSGKGEGYGNTGHGVLSLGIQNYNFVSLDLQLYNRYCHSPNVSPTIYNWCSRIKTNKEKKVEKKY